MKIISLAVLIFGCLISHQFAMADVLINLAKEDEISISNTQLDASYTFKIEEPLLQPSITGIGATHSNLKALASNKLHQLPYNNEVMQAASETALEPALIHAVIATESKYNARAKSNKGALGLMQLMPATARRFNVKDNNDPKQNILAGSKYLRELLNLYQGDLKLTLAAYNAGPGAVQKYSNQIPPYKETMRYVPQVLKYYKKYS